MKKNPFNKRTLGLKHLAFRRDVDLSDVDWPDGANNTAGTAQYIYIGKVSDYDFIPDVDQPDPTGNGSLEDLVTISGDYVLKPGKSPVKVYVTLETGKIDSETQGEFDGISFVNKLEFLVPGSTAKALGLSAYAKNGSFIVHVPLIDGQKRVIGHRNYPAKLVSSPATTGQKSADRKGITFTFQSVAPYPAPIHTGKVKVSGVGSGVDADGDGNMEIMFAD